MYSCRCYNMLAGAFVTKNLLQELHLFSMYYSLMGWPTRFYYPISMHSLAYTKALTSLVSQISSEHLLCI